MQCKKKHGPQLEGHVKMEESERFFYECQIRELKEELKPLNPSYNPSQDMYYYVKTKEKLLGVISAQNKKLVALSSGSRMV